jgi:hypothetical protein
MNKYDDMPLRPIWQVRLNCWMDANWGWVVACVMIIVIGTVVWLTNTYFPIN